MLTIIPDLPPYVFAVTATGAVDTTDMEKVLLPGLQHLVDTYDEIHYLLVLETSVGNFTTGSWLQDMKAGIKFFTKWKKIAIVTDQESVEIFSDMFSIAVPGNTHGFKLNELEAAKEWISKKED